MIRRWAYNTRHTVRHLSRRLLDRLDPPDSPPPPPAAPPAPPARPEALSVEVEATPNPLATRFGLSRPVGEVHPQSPLGMRLHGIDGVADVFGGQGFVTVTRAAGSDEHQVIEAVKEALLALG